MNCSISIVGPLRLLEVNAQHLPGFLDDRGAFSPAARNAWTAE